MTTSFGLISSFGWSTDRIPWLASMRCLADIPGLRERRDVIERPAEPGISIKASA
jgi:hypothetical protein